MLFLNCKLFVSCDNKHCFRSTRVTLIHAFVISCSTMFRQRLGVDAMGVDRKLLCFLEGNRHAPQAADTCCFSRAGCRFCGGAVRAREGAGAGSNGAQRIRPTAHPSVRGEDGQSLPGRWELAPAHQAEGLEGEGHGCVRVRVCVCACLSRCARLWVGVVEIDER